MPTSIQELCLAGLKAKLDELADPVIADLKIYRDYAKDVSRYPAINMVVDSDGQTELAGGISIRRAAVDLEIYTTGATASADAGEIAAQAWAKAQEAEDAVAEIFLVLHGGEDSDPEAEIGSAPYHFKRLTVELEYHVDQTDPYTSPA